MTELEKLSLFVDAARFGHLSTDALGHLKIRVLDSLAAAFGALGAEPVDAVYRFTRDFGGTPRVSLIGGAQADKTSPDRAAFYNGTLIRYLDFNDSFIAPGETCHPSDNLGAVLAAAEDVDASGEEFLTALAVAYQVQILLSEHAPVRSRGFDHTTQGAYSVAAGVAKALRLPKAQIANAIAMSGTANNALRVTRTGNLSHWKGLAFPHVAFSATHCAYLAKYGITGPLEIFEGNKGFQQSIAGPFQIDWEGDGLEGIKRTILKKYNAEIHSQTVLETVLNLKLEHGFAHQDVDRVEVDTFQVAYDIIGGGEEGDKTLMIRTKEEADHSLPYLVAVALVDSHVMPAQFEPQAIARPEVQELLRRVKIRPKKEFTDRFPAEMPCAVRIFLKSGQLLQEERADYEGFFTRPMSWSVVESKFHRLAEKQISDSQRQEVIECVQELEKGRIRKLTALFKQGQAKTERAFSFIPRNPRPEKPRTQGITEIRGPYYSVLGVNAFQDIIDTMGAYVDGLKFAGGSFALMPEGEVKRLIDLAHQNQIYVSTGGWIERVLSYGSDAVDRYIHHAAELGFDMVEISTGFITLPTSDLFSLIDQVKKAGMKAKPELGIQFGAGGATSTQELKAEGTRDVGWLIQQARLCLDHGASIIMIESEGITESVDQWRTDVIAAIVNGVGLGNVMFEASDPQVFEWYVKNYGSEVNLFVDHSQIVQLEALRSGIWGTKSTWGRIVGYEHKAA